MPNDSFWRGVAANDIDYEPHDQISEVEAATEAVRERAEVAVSILGVPKGLVGARQHGLEVAENGVDPIELRQISGFALAGDLDLVGAPGLGDGRKAVRTIAEHRAAGRQIGLHPGQDCVVEKDRGRRDLHVQGVAGIVERGPPRRWGFCSPSGGRACRRRAHRPGKRHRPAPDPTGGLGSRATLSPS